MKAAVFSVLCFLFTIFSYAQNNDDILTNETIIQLTKIGLQPSVIINKIQTSITKFDVSKT